MRIKIIYHKLNFEHEKYSRTKLENNFNLVTKVYFDFDEIIYLRTQKIIEFCDYGSFLSKLRE